MRFEIEMVPCKMTDTRFMSLNCGRLFVFLPTKRWQFHDSYVQSKLDITEFGITELSP